MRAEINQRRYRRSLKLRELGSASYAAYLRSPHWHRTRAAYFASDHPQDCICGETDGLQLHHLTYERIGAELLTDLTPLCSRCHAMIHVLECRGEIGLDFTGFVSAERAKRHALDQERFFARQTSFTDLHADTRQKHEIRSVAAEIRELGTKARKRGIDIAPNLAAIRRIIEELRSQMVPPPESA